MKMIEKIAAFAFGGTKALAGLGAGTIAAGLGTVAAINLLTGRGKRQAEAVLKRKEREVEKLRKRLEKLR